MKVWDWITGEQQEQSKKESKAMVPASAVPENPPDWAKQLNERLDSVNGNLGQLVASGALRREIESAVNEWRKERKRQDDALNSLRDFVMLGKACQDCRATKKEIIEAMQLIISQREGLDDEYGAEGYGTRSEAFRAGWGLAFNKIKLVIGDIEARV
jgi:hypothetical protein